MIHDIIFCEVVFGIPIQFVITITFQIKTILKSLLSEKDLFENVKFKKSSSSVIIVTIENALARTIH